MTRTVAGLFRNFDDAQNAINALLGGGFDHDSIDLMANNSGDRLAAGSTNLGDASGVVTDVVEDTLVGAGKGAVVGGMAGLAVGLATLVIPGVGPVLAIGSLALAGAEIGALGGGLIGALSEMGLTHPEAQHYAEGIRNGGALVLVRASSPSGARAAADILDRFDPIDISWGSWMSFSPADGHNAERDPQLSVRDPDVYAEEDGLMGTTPALTGIREYAARM